MSSVTPRRYNAHKTTQQELTTLLYLCATWNSQTFADKISCFMCHYIFTKICLVHIFAKYINLNRALIRSTAYFSIYFRACPARALAPKSQWEITSICDALFRQQNFK